MGDYHHDEFQEKNHQIILYFCFYLYSFRIEKQ